MDKQLRDLLEQEKQEKEREEAKKGTDALADVREVTAKVFNARSQGKFQVIIQEFAKGGTFDERASAAGKAVQDI